MSRAQPEKDAEQEGGQRDAAGVGRRKHHSRLRMDGAHPDRPFWGWGSELHTSCMGLVHVPSTAWLAASYRHVLPPLKKILMCTNALTSLMNHFFISSFIIPSSWGHFQLMANSFVTLNQATGQPALVTAPQVFGFDFMAPRRQTERSDATPSVTRFATHLEPTR